MHEVTTKEQSYRSYSRQRFKSWNGNYILGGGLGCIAVVSAQNIGGVGNSIIIRASVFIFVMFSMKKIEAADCSGACSPFEMPTCGSIDCRCIPIALVAGFCINPTGLSSVAKMIDEHWNLCQSDDECMKKGSGNFCARYPNNYIDYGWCFHSGSEALKGFLAMPATITK